MDSSQVRVVVKVIRVDGLQDLHFLVEDKVGIRQEVQVKDRDQVHLLEVDFPQLKDQADQLSNLVDKFQVEALARDTRVVDLQGLHFQAEDKVDLDLLQEVDSPQLQGQVDLHNNPVDSSQVV